MSTKKPRPRNQTLASPRHYYYSPVCKGIASSVSYSWKWNGASGLSIFSGSDQGEHWAMPPMARWLLMANPYTMKSPVPWHDLEIIARKSSVSRSIESSIDQSWVLLCLSLVGSCVNWPSSSET